MAERDIPTGRYRRLARMGRATGGQAAKQAGTRAANLVRSDEAARSAVERRHVQTAEQIVAVLGTMKGASMKLGQMLSFLNIGLVDEEHREEFQQKLAALRDNAPVVPFKDMRDVIERELGKRLGEAFADFEREPIAAASIGQVYRAELADGRAVAVKVQYPGVAAAVRSDMQNLGLIARLFGGIAPQLDMKAFVKEVSREILDELDYELEASNQRALARIYRAHPFIVIPSVVPELCGERVIVMDFIEGEDFGVLERESERERDRLGEIVFRFYFGSMYRHNMFSGDPHPGNLLRQPDGRVAFLDFGLFKHMKREPVEITLGILRSLVERDEAELHRLLASDGFLHDPSRFEPAELMTYMLDAYWWCVGADRDVTIAPALTAELINEYLLPRATHFTTTRQLDIDAVHMLGRRLELCVLGVLGQLKATANWHRISREWLYGDPPVTELGVQEASFLEAGSPVLSGGSA
jgi:predicted unusual protein kinase regulating ubiquinone biosynthesis (AarF/ABC1/UbiB family)